MLERFDDNARRALVIARAKAAVSGAATIDVGHVLLGLVAEPVGPVAEILARCGVDLRVLCDALGDKAAPSTPTGSFRMGEDARELLLWATREALRLHHDLVGPAHLLLAVHPAAPDGRAAAALDAQGATRERVRSAAIDVLAENPPAGRAAPKPPWRPDPDQQPAAAGATRTPGSVGAAPASPRRSGEPRRSVLAQFATNLTELAAEGRIDPVVGRARELERMMAVLSRRTKNNVVLVGEPGVGKTAVVEGFARAIVAGEVPEHFEGAEVYSLELGSLIAGTKLRGDLEERVKRICNEVASRPEVILFIDEIHNLVGSNTGRLDVANIIKPLLARGELTTIGATTADEYAKHFEADAALARRFQRLDVDEPSEGDAVAILAGLRGAYEEHHRVRFTDEAVTASVRLAKRYQRDRFLPDSAVDLLDEAGARAAMLRRDGTEVSVVDADAVAEVLAVATGLPTARLTAEQTERLLVMEAELGRRVIGQRDAVAAVSRAVRRSSAGLGDERRPTGSFIFAGPTGVGKTELAKALAEFLFGDDTALITLDMSEYMDRHTVSRLVGSPPGYVGHDEGGQLTEAVRRRPYAVVLFDEIEKAHPSVFDVLLQILEEGRLTDSQGQVVDFSNTVIIMTSNLGTSELRSPSFGFQSRTEASSFERLRRHVDDALRGHFRPEFLNRVDEVVCFSELTAAEVGEIAALFCAELAERVAATGRTLEVTPAAVALLADAGYDPAFGARPLRRAVQSLVENPVSEGLLAGSFEEGATIVVDAVDGDIAVVGVPALAEDLEVEAVH